AVQTLVNVKLLSQSPSTLVSSNVTVAFPQLSVAVNVAASGTSDAQETFTVAAGNVPTKVGLISSFTVMVCVCTVVFPHASVAVQTLVNVKLLSQSSSTLVSSNVTVAFPQLSVAVNVAASGTCDAQE